MREMLTKAYTVLYDIVDDTKNTLPTEIRDVI